MFDTAVHVKHNWQEPVDMNKLPGGNDWKHIPMY